MMASLMSVVALAIDALLPALEIIGFAIGTQQAVDNQLLITMIFLGLGVGPLIFGPLSDAMGRKPVVYMGLVLFVIASFICVHAPNLEMMIFGRILQGIGLAAPRTIAIAIIRDLYRGDYMARIMSFVTVVFLLVPIVAPLLGQWIMDAYNWQGIFYVQIVSTLLVTLWFWRRQPETLEISKRIRFSLQRFVDGFKEIIQHKTTMGYTYISGFVVGSFLVYLSSSQYIFQELYDLKAEFPYIFAALAIAIGTAIFLNGSLVLRFGMKKLISTSLIGYFLVSVMYVLLYADGSNPPVTILLSFFALQFFCIGFLFGNLRAMAMDPVGHIAGIAAAITGFISTIMAVPISTLIGRQVSDSVLPLFLGFLVCSFISLIVLWLLRKS